MNRILILIICAGIFNACNNKKEWHKFDNGVFTIEYPEYLEINKNLNPAADLACQNEEKQVFFLVLNENRDSLSAKGYPEMNLVQYLVIIRENHKASGMPYKIISEKKVNVGDLSGAELLVQHDLSSENNGIKTFSKGRQVAISGKKGFYQVYLWSNEDDYENFQEDFGRIINSFKEL